jgi:beta-lactamase class A
LLEYAPTTARHVAEGQLTMRALCEAAVTVSDNTAANLLLRKLGGPAKLTEFARSCGDPVTRLDRFEPDLNENAPNDLRDTTTPRAMVGLMREVLCGRVLADASRERLIEWLEACETGKNRLRAGLPRDWRAGDKTGSGRRGAANDVAIGFPPGRAPILIAAYLNGPGVDSSVMAAAQAEIGRLVVEEFSWER